MSCAVWVVVGVITIVLPRRGATAAVDTTVDGELLVDESIADAASGEDGIPVRTGGAPR
jgi:hypothetical protein